MLQRLKFCIIKCCTKDHAVMPFPRTSGILLHPTSFPGPYGIGDLGASARQFIDFLARSGQSLWQILPLGPTGYGNSPYMCYSAMAGNPLLISLDDLAEQGLLDEWDLTHHPDFDPDFIDFDAVMAWKMPLLRKASLRFKDQALPEVRSQFADFCQAKAHWLEDYALFMALLETRPEPLWSDWPVPLRDRDPDALHQARLELAVEIGAQQFWQFEFFRQWTALRNYANDNDIQVFGDIPIYVSHNSADVWANPQLFQLDEDKQPKSVAGVPPDYFSVTGQRWGNPLYDWDVLKEAGFAWWIMRFRDCLELVDLIRIDHFRAFDTYWSVPAEEETAVNGEWLQGPGAPFFVAVRDALGSLPIIAEDLGDIGPSVLELRDEFEFPGMKILHFAFGSDANNPYLPFRVTPNSVVYTGTHDNDTTCGWYEAASDYERGRFLQYLGCTGPDGIAWDMIRVAMSSVANQAIVPLQDVCSLGTDARMNTPGTAEGNWRWLYRAEALTQEYGDRLRDMALIYGRYEPKPPKPESQEFDGAQDLTLSTYGESV
ncbi:MAG: 4-alpha-glucanotransferase [Thermosynechococcaceae cyanobacterium]